MKKISIFMILALCFLLRFATSVKFNDLAQNGIYKMELNLKDSKISINKVNSKFPIKNIYGKLYNLKNGEYKGYFLVKYEKNMKSYSYVELENIHSVEIEPNFFKKYLYKTFEISQDNFQIATKNMNRSIILGENDISKKLKEKIRYIGLSHIFAMSGLHMFLIFYIVYSITKRLLKSKILIEILSLIFITVYFLGVKQSPSFTRAYIMMVIFILVKLFYEKASLKKSLLISAFISIFIKPTIIFSLSFQLSYLSIIAIIYLYPIFQKLNFRKNKFLSCFLLSLSIQIFLSPLLIYNFATLPLLSVFTNLLIVPVATAYISLNYIFIFLANFHLSFLLEPFIKLLYFIFITLINLFSKIPYLSINFHCEKILYFYFFFFVVIIYFNWYKYKNKD